MPDLNWRPTVYETVALPAELIERNFRRNYKGRERITGFEPVTSTLARLHSTAELNSHFAQN